MKEKKKKKKGEEKSERREKRAAKIDRGFHGGVRAEIYQALRECRAGAFIMKFFFLFPGECLINVQEFRFGGTKGKGSLLIR